MRFSPYHKKKSAPCLKNYLEKEHNRRKDNYEKISNENAFGFWSEFWLVMGYIFVPMIIGISATLYHEFEFFLVNLFLQF